MEVKTEAKYLRVSPRKLRLLVPTIKILKPKEAVERLSCRKEKVAQVFLKAIKTGIADAVSNFKLKEENLRFKKIEVNKGPVLKRWRAAARGTAHPYQRPTSHLKIILEEGKKF